MLASDYDDNCIQIQLTKLIAIELATKNLLLNWFHTFLLEKCIGYQNVINELSMILIFDTV